MIWVKICGIRDVETALAAADAGADAVGFVFAPTRRQVCADVVRNIVKALPPAVARVGVFANESLSKVEEIATYCGLDIVQLHGEEPPEYCKLLRHRVIKAFSVGKHSLESVNDYPVEAILLDTYVPGMTGGTGKSFNWELVQGLNCIRPIILAGGLTAENVQEAIRKVRPYGVDVSSGVETGGIKDKQKIRHFVRQARSAI